MSERNAARSPLQTKHGACMQATIAQHLLMLSAVALADLIGFEIFKRVIIERRNTGVLIYFSTLVVCTAHQVRALLPKAIQREHSLKRGKRLSLHHLNVQLEPTRWSTSTPSQVHAFGSSTMALQNDTHPMKTIPSLILLHGSRGSTQELIPFAQHMVAHCNPILPNLLGHGGRPIPDQFSVHDMALDILQQMDTHGIESTYLFGYSFGGYIALYLAKHAPERILGICTLATKFLFDKHTVDLFTHLSSVDRIRSQQKEIMDQRHPGQNWDHLVRGLAVLYQNLGQTPELTEADLRSINVPSLIISANEDQLVPWSESLKLAYSLPHGQGFTFAGKAHPIDIIPVPFLAGVITTWLECIAPPKA